VLIVSADLVYGNPSKKEVGIYHQVWYSKPSENEAIKVKKNNAQNKPTPTQVTG